LITVARRLALASPKKPRQADLRRSINSAYYALFHALAKDAADLVAGVGQRRPEKAWAQVYRSLQHGEAKTACENARNLNFPASIIFCADAFVALQKRRHDADYNPTFRASRQLAIEMVQLAEDAISNLKASTRQDRKAFAILLLLRRR
jgi:uncharacterized protein (UPF0332 family)